MEALGTGCDVFRPLSDVLLCGHRCAGAGMLRSTAAPSPGPGEGGSSSRIRAFSNDLLSAEWWILKAKGLCPLVGVGAKG